MDTYISNGDFETNVQGYPRPTYGTEEALQRARFILQTQKGEFPYDREFGTNWTVLSDYDATEERVMMICREAFAGRNDFFLESVDISRIDEGILRICISCSEGKAFGEVFISG